MKELKTIREVTEAILDGEEVESMNPDTGEWFPLKSLCILVDRIDNNTKSVFRIKATKPSIDWNHVSDNFNFLARDEDGLTWLYGNKPKRQKSLWWTEGDDAFIAAGAFKSLDAGNCDWKDSLVERPKE